MNYFMALYRRLVSVQPEAGVRRMQLISAGNSCFRIRSCGRIVLRKGRNKRGDLLSCEVHVMYAISAFQTKPPTASSVGAINLWQVIYVLGCIFYRIVDVIEGGNQWAVCDVSSLTRLILDTSASRTVWVGCFVENIAEGLTLG